MKKKFLLTTILPIVTLVGLIGSGYSIFIFAENNKTSADANAIEINNVTDNLSSGDILIYGGVSSGDGAANKNCTKLVFDKTRYDSNNNVIKGTGIHLTNNEAANDNRMGAYYLWTNNETIAKCINENKKDDANSTSFDGYVKWKRVLNGNTGEDDAYDQMCTITARTGQQVPFVDGETDIKFTVSIQIPYELAQYINLEYVGSDKSSINHGWSEVKVGVDNNDSSKIWNITYTYTAYYSQLDPSKEYFKEIYNETGKLEDYVNHEYKTQYEDESNPKAKFGFKFFDWKDVEISAYNKSTTNQNDSDYFKKIHNEEPTTIEEYNSMMTNLSNVTGKNGVEHYHDVNYNNQHLCSLGCTYSAQVVNK